MDQTLTASRQPGQTSAAKPVVALLMAVLLWGGSFAAMRFAVGSLPPTSVMWLRMIIALVAILPFVKARRLWATYRKGDWKLLLPMILFQPCLYFLLESNALQLTTSSQAGVISASVPLLVTIGAGLVLSEPILPRSLAGLFLSMAGVAALTLLNDGSGMATNALLGNLMELAAMVCAAANMIIVKQLCRRYNPWSLTALQILAGCLFFAPGAFSLLADPTVFKSPALVAALFFLGGGVTLGAFGLYNWSMSQIPASKASSFINLVPVTAVFIGWTLMGERLGPWQCLAAAGVILGVWFSQTRPRKS